MLTGELKSQIDRIWDTFWSRGISNPLEVIEQITYLLFIRRLDDLQILEENKAKGAIMAGLNMGIIEAMAILSRPSPSNTNSPVVSLPWGN